MQPHHLYATCASLMSMAMRLSWYRVDANLGLHFGLRIQDSDTKNKAEIPLRDFSIIVHAKLCGTQTEFCCLLNLIVHEGNQGGHNHNRLAGLWPPQFLAGDR